MNDNLQGAIATLIRVIAAWLACRIFISFTREFNIDWAEFIRFVSTSVEQEEAEMKASKEAARRKRCTSFVARIPGLAKFKNSSR